MPMQWLWVCGQSFQSWWICTWHLLSQGWTLSPQAMMMMCLGWVKLFHFLCSRWLWFHTISNSHWSSELSPERNFYSIFIIQFKLACFYKVVSTFLWRADDDSIFSEDEWDVKESVFRCPFVGGGFFSGWIPRESSYDTLSSRTTKELNHVEKYCNKKDMRK